MEKLTKENNESEIQNEDLKERFEELQNNQVKLVSNLDKCKTSDADLVISRQETKNAMKNCNLKRTKLFTANLKMIHISNLFLN